MLNRSNRPIACSGSGFSRREAGAAAGPDFGWGFSVLYDLVTSVSCHSVRCVSVSCLFLLGCTPWRQPLSVVLSQISTLYVLKLSLCCRMSDKTRLVRLKDVGCLTTGFRERDVDLSVCFKGVRCLTNRLTLNDCTSWCCQLSDRLLCGV